MKKVILSLSLVVAVAFSANAQKDKGRKPVVKDKQGKETVSTPTPAPAPAPAVTPAPAPAPATITPSVAPATPVSNADIKFDKLVHDYGTIKNGADGNCEFLFTNTGTEPLILSNCQGSCGCTVPTCPKEPILPGKQGSIKVHYDTKRTGQISKSVMVYSNAKSGTLTLQIKGTVEPPPPAEEPFPATKPTTAPVEK